MSERADWRKVEAGEYENDRWVVCHQQDEGGEPWDPNPWLWWLYRKDADGRPDFVDTFDTMREARAFVSRIDSVRSQEGR